VSTHPELGYFDEGLELTDPSLYKSALLPFGKARGLVPAAYRSKIFADLEDEKIWTRMWVCIGTEGEFAGSGDMLPYTVGNHGIHVQRSDDGSLVGRFNMAQHGGCRAVPLQCQTGVKTKCSFASCGYSRDRGVIPASELGENTPTMRQFLGYRPDRLFPIKVDTRGPFVFVNLDQEAKALKTQLAGEAGKLLRIATKDLTDEGGFWTESKSNWKLSAKTLMSRIKLEFGLSDEQVSGPVAGPGQGRNLFAALQADREGKQRGAAKVFVLWLFPNLLLACTPDSLVSIVLQPTGMDETNYRVRHFSRNAGKVNSLGVDPAQVESRWRALLDTSGQEAESLQIQALNGTTRANGPSEDQPWNHRFHGFLVGRILTEHKYVWANPLFHQPGR